MGIIGTDWQDKMYVGGAWRPGSGDTLKVVAPASGEVLGALASASPADVDAAATQAADAQADWAARTPSERAAVLRRAGHLWEEHAEEIGEWIVKETGAIPPKAGLET
ncbi:MAG: aldehyde dehydrogenase family protein, partial [Nocardioidaceae bacterium]|nr:aldehyde dehydrogenase family protein [Nocardioidaceae bacterium]